MGEEKKCSKCGAVKPTTEFHKCKSNKDGHQKVCKTCRVEYATKKRLFINEKSKQHYLKNRDSKLSYAKEYRDTHREDINFKKREYREKNLEKIKKAEKQYRENNKEKLKKRKRIYREENSEKVNQYFREKYERDVNYKIAHISRNRMNKVLKGNLKCSKTVSLLGCTIDDLRAHLEEQFKEGMTWDNYGRYGWHIDHIIPCDAFDLSDPEQQKKCFHYTNLQPLWAKENLSKSNKLV